MAVLSVRVVLLIIITCGVVFTSLQMDVLKYIPDASDSGETSWKTKTVIGEQNPESRTLANRKHRYELTLSNGIHADTFDSAFPFDQESDYEKGAEFRTNNNRGVRNNLERNDAEGEIRNDPERGIRNNAEAEIRNDPTDSKIKTFFSSLKTSFKDVLIGSDQSIPTLKFLDACLETVKLFANMKRRILDRVVADVQGNIEKIQKNYDALPRESSTLQSMVLRDIEQLHLNANDPDYYSTSTLLALEWLIRAFQFISRFLTHICEGEEQTPSAKIAYEETLKKHHGFAVRTLFRAAFLTLSTRHDFIKELAMNEADVDRPDFEEIAMADLQDYNIALNERLKVIEEFFLQHDIEV